MSTDCQDARQQAKSSYSPRFHAETPSPKSQIIGDLLIDDPLIDHFERSSNLLVPRTAAFNPDRHLCENAAICHDRRCSNTEGEIPIRTLSGDLSSCSNQELDGSRTTIKQIPSEYLDELVHAVEQPAPSHGNDDPADSMIYAGVDNFLKEH